MRRHYHPQREALDYPHMPFYGPRQHSSAAAVFLRQVDGVHGKRNSCNGRCAWSRPRQTNLNHGRGAARGLAYAVSCPAWARVHGHSRVDLACPPYYFERRWPHYVGLVTLRSFHVGRYQRSSRISVRRPTGELFRCAHRANAIATPRVQGSLASTEEP